MKAEDTVKQQIYPQNHEEHLKSLQSQAKISFKIGKTAGVAESLIPSLKAIEASHKEGIREVVEWIERHCESDDNNPIEFSIFPEKSWQAQKKTWGIAKATAEQKDEEIDV